MFRVCLFGHSFPARLSRFGREHSNYLSSMPDDCSLDMQGHSGLTFARVFASPARYLSPLREFDAILVDLGTNDLCDVSISPSLLVTRALHLVHLFEQHGVKPRFIIFLSPIQRTGIFRQGQVTVSTFNNRVKKFNTQLKARVASLSPRVQVKFQSVINRPKYIADGCHLTHEGMLKYVENIVAIIIKLKCSLD